MPVLDKPYAWVLLVLAGWLILRLLVAFVVAFHNARYLGQRHPYTLMVWVSLSSGFVWALFAAIGWRLFLADGPLAFMGCFSLVAGIAGFIVGLTVDYFTTVRIQSPLARALVARRSSTFADQLLRGEAEQRRDAARAFAFIGQDSTFAVPQLLEAFHDTDADLRYFVALALLNVNADDPAIDRAMLKALSDGDLRIRSIAAVLLVKREKAEAEVVLPHLCAGLKMDVEEVRLCSAEALGLLGPLAASAVPHLIAHLNDGYNMTYSARSALARIGPAALPELVELLKSDDRRIRITAIEVLADMHAAATSALPMLRELLMDSDMATRRAVIRAITRIHKSS